MASICIDRTRQITCASDGRNLCFAEFGDLESGYPVFYLHGYPSSRLEARIINFVPRKHKRLRFIGIDRPGIGLSSPHPNRCITDHAKDILAVADHLGISNFAVMGCSAGGPYALACAAVIPRERLTAVLVVCGSPPDVPPKPREFWQDHINKSAGNVREQAANPHKQCAMSNEHEMLTRYMLHTRMEKVRELLRVVDRQSLEKNGILEKMVKIEDTGRLPKDGADDVAPAVKGMISDNDFEALQNALESARQYKIRSSEPATMERTRKSLAKTDGEAYRQGHDGAVGDIELLDREWDFRLKDIQFPRIKIWHGQNDKNCDTKLTRKMAQHIPRCVYRELTHETHFSIGDYTRVILDDFIPDVPDGEARNVVSARMSVQYGVKKGRGGRGGADAKEPQIRPIL